jgi:3-oxoacyl-[acyl-carrier-protein] synthase-3
MTRQEGRGLEGIGLEVLGSGEYVPSERVESAALDRRWGRRDGWTFEHTGVESRAFASADEDVVSMGAAAARLALDDAGLFATQIDALIAVGSVPAQAIPCTAAFIHRALGVADSGVAAFDINATCLGFLAALDLVASAIGTGRYRHVMIVASEMASAGLNMEDGAIAGLFGDGAGAIVLGAPRREGRLLASNLRTFSSGVEHCQVRAGGTRLHPRHRPAEEHLAGTFFEMNGPTTYRLAASVLPAFLDDLLAKAGISVGDVDTWIAHQASGKALSHLEKHLGLPPERFVRTLSTHGNQISASLPITLHHARRAGRLVPGSVSVLIGTGAGLSVGGAVLRS